MRDTCDTEKNEDGEKPLRTLRRSQLARYYQKRRWFALMISPLILLLITAWAPAARLKQFGTLGLVQPSIAAMIALVVVLGMRLTWGRFSSDRRKGAISASSATIAVKLWALCFALLFGSMMLSAVVSRLPENFSPLERTTIKPVETQFEISTNQSAAVAVKARVAR